MTRHSGISIDDDGITLVIASEAPGSGPAEIAFAPALLVLGEGGHPAAGRRARRLAAAGTGAAFADFTLRVGDPVPVVGSDGSTRDAADLVALTIACLLRDQASPQAPDQHLTIAHPSSWGSYQLGELRAGLTRAELDGLPTTFVPRAVAAERTNGGSRADAVIVADLGRHRTEITTVREARVDAVRTDDLGSADLDRAVLRHVLGELAGEPSDIHELTARCRVARRELTANPVAVVEAQTTRGFERIRVTRAEFEGAVNESVSVAVLNICRALGDAVEKGASTYRVLIVGDGAELPLLTQTLSAEAGLNPAVAADAAAVATGAALISGERARTARVTSTPARHVPASRPNPTTPPVPSRPRPLSAPSLPRAIAEPRRVTERAPAPTPRPIAAPTPRPASRPSRPTPRGDWPTAPAQRSGGRIRTAIVAAAAGLAVLVGGVAVTTGGGGHGGGFHAGRY